jgi:hypothetical protein
MGVFMGNHIRTSKKRNETNNYTKRLWSELFEEETISFHLRSSSNDKWREIGIA